MGFRQIAVGVVRSDAGIAYISPRAIVDRAEELRRFRQVGEMAVEVEVVPGPPRVVEVA